MAYCEVVKFSSTGNYGCGPKGEDDVYTVKEFKRICFNQGFIDDDGFGHPVRAYPSDPDVFLCDPDTYVHPSKIHEIPEDATHIVWYNR